MDIHIQTERLHTKQPLCFTDTSGQALEFALFSKVQWIFQSVPLPLDGGKKQLLERV